MKIALLALVLSAPALAQDTPASATAACGHETVSYKVNLDDSPHTLSAPEPGKARIYFIHDSGGAGSFTYPTTKIGIDGAWVGANHTDSYFSVSVDPGEHHFCATLQSAFYGHSFELAHLTVEPGKSYFYRTRFLLWGNVGVLELEPIDSDQGRYLVTSFPLSVSNRKK